MRKYIFVQGKFKGVFKGKVKIASMNYSQVHHKLPL